jgi:hypothetical protein
MVGTILKKNEQLTLNERDQRLAAALWRWHVPNVKSQIQTELWQD